MSMYNLSALLAALLTAFIAWSVILRDRHKRHYRAFTVFAFNLSAWFIARAIDQTLHSPLTTWISFACAAGLPSAAERFFRAFLAPDPQHPEPISKGVWSGTVIAALGLAAGLVWPLTSSLWFGLLLFAFTFGSLAYACLYLVAQRRQSLQNRSERLRLTYLLYGGGTSLAFAAADFLRNVGVPFPPLGTVLSVIFMYFVSQTLFHYRLLDIKELLAKMVTLTSLVLILSGVYGLLLGWVGAGQSGLFFFNTTIASFVILVIFEPLRRFVEHQISRWIFAEQYEFGRRLATLGRELTHIIEVRPLVSRLLVALEESGRATHVSIYLSDPSRSRYRLAGHLGPAPLDELDGTIRHLFLERLRRDGLLSRVTLEREQADQADEGVASAHILETLGELLADVCVPMVVDGQLLAFLNLRDERMRDAYASDELQRLKHLAAQAATTLRNSKLYEEMKERDRLAALGQMAAGLAHEIRNPLGAIKGAAQLLRGPEDEAVPEDGSAEFLDVIIEEVDRLNRVVSQFLGYARPDRGERSPTPINEVVRKTALVLRSEHADTTLELVLELSPELPPVLADAEQLRQVFLNLAQNGIQSMNASGRLTIRTGVRPLFRDGRTDRYVEIAFEDNGPGIGPETLHDLFIPFFTTKEGGTGLGLPICQRIVEGHDGLIEVQSDPGRQTTFAVLIPAADPVDATVPRLGDTPKAPLRA